MISIATVVVLSTSIVSGVIYLSLKDNLTAEFRERIKAENGELGLLLKNRLSTVKNQLKSLALDNTIRVTLMLGANQQLQDFLNQTVSAEQDLHVFIVKNGTEECFTASRLKFDIKKNLTALDKDNHIRLLEKDPRHGFKLTYIFPVYRQKSQIGSLIGVYLFSKDDVLVNFFQNRESSRALILSNHHFWNLFDGQQSGLTKEIEEDFLPDSGALHNHFEGEKFIFNLRNEIPGLYLISSLDGLNEKTEQVFNIILLPALIVVCLTILITLLLSNKLASPLHRISELALKAAEGDSDLSEHVDSSVVEIEKLISSLRTMLKKLQRIQELQRYQELFDKVADIVLIHDFQGNVLEANRVASQMVDAAKRDPLDVCIFDFIPVEEQPQILEKLDNLYRNEREIRFETTLISETGEKRFVECHARKILYDDKLVALNVVRDLTAMKTLEKEKEHSEEQLRKVQKMEAVGTLAAGVAHDLNNILSGLVSYPDLLLYDIPDDSPLKKPILTIKSTGEKAAAIVQDMLTLARRGVVTSEVICLNEIIKEYLQSPEYVKLASYHKRVKVKTDLGEDLFNILGSPVHLSKTIMNLVSNAAEAIEDEGTITITTRACYVDKPIGGYETIEEGEYILLSIEDTGSGMSPEDCEKIFEPFYTKKTMGRSGTGLGMSVVWSTVKDLEGFIDISTKIDQGTTFYLYFPATRKELAKKQTHLPIGEYKGGGQSILVVDDVKEQREVAEMILSQLNYNATAVSSGEEAIEYLRQHTVDLVILDMIMDPGIDGLETYKRILEIHPGQRAIITSGYSETERVRETMKLGAARYIKKPYVLEQLASAVKAQLTHA
ncbi:response regulator [uncultured Desulfosarcina sp.]|uniref:hybrid sensor histidine kinase/response regulator n=1 Tax=uncultured Desulfosarcina sp. TaxID=218289 RepID=UPI0037487577